VEREGVSATWEASVAVGANIVGYTFLVRQGKYLLQAPLSWYREKDGSDLTPGYEAESLVHLEHPVRSACLFCRAGSLETVRGTSNRFEVDSVTAISCERCHGPVARHLERPVRGSIVNPASLPAKQRDSVCEQCHLEGEARILNAGRNWW